MVINQLLRERCNNACELCSKSDSQLTAYSVPPGNDHTVNEQVVLCSECMKQIVAKDYSNAQYWRFLEGSIWSETPSVQVLSYKVLKELSSEDWARDASENTSLDESLLAWAHAEEKMESEKIIHKDCYGTILQTGDTVILTQNLNVKGTSYIAPKGTIIRKVKLVQDNADQIEGKINSDMIVILTKYVRRQA